MNLLKHYFVPLSLLLTLSIFCANDLSGQSSKKILGIEDVELWRNHSVTLSDDGAWYTVLYALSEKPDPEKDRKSDTLKYSYGEDNETDILYVYNVKSGLKYEIPEGKGPIFSSNSEWIAYIIIPKPDKKEKDDPGKIVELRNLKSGKCKQYKTNASYSFTEDKNYFITSDKSSLLVYDLDNLTEHYIAKLGEFIVDKKSDYIAYTINSEDKRGNGIYLYKPQDKTTRALETGNYIYSDLTWNKNYNSMAAIRYNEVKKESDIDEISVVLISGIDTDSPESSAIMVKDIEGLPDKMGPAPKKNQLAKTITWSNDNERLFMKIKEYDIKEEVKKKEEDADDDKSTVNIWHWKDEKLLSQTMLEEKRKTNEVFDAVLHISSQTITRLTGDEIQNLITSPGTDKWSIGTDNRKYISDWDVRKNDLYRINLKSGDKKLLESKSSGGVQMSPDGTSMVIWDGKDYLLHDLDKDTKRNLSSELDISFINTDNDHWGIPTSYGFVGWVKGRNAVLVNHKYDLWMLPLDNSAEAVNLTGAISPDSNIQFRIDDMSNTREPEIEDRYIDLSSPIILSAFNRKNKYAGYFKLDKNKLEKLIYKDASYSASRRRSGLTRAKNSDAVIYRIGDYTSFPESYLSDENLRKSEKVTNTNPQQEDYLWGHRILIEYTNDDGVPLQGVLSIPDTYKKGQKLPMVVYSYEKMSQTMYSYSSPGLSGSRICEMMYVSDGYLVLLPDIHFNVRTPHSDMHECIDAAIKKVIELGYVDERYIGYEGFSYGGHTGMFISTQDNNRFAAIAAGAGVSNLVQGFNIDLVGDGSNEQDYYMGGQGRLGSDPATDTEMFISESAVFSASTMNTPLLLFHGTKDSVVQWEHSFGFYSILRYLKKPVVFLSYSGEGHGLRQKANRLDIQKRLKEYFDHYLKGKEASPWIMDGVPYKVEKDAKKDSSKSPLWK